MKALEHVGDPSMLIQIFHDMRLSVLIPLPILLFSASNFSLAGKIYSFHLTAIYC